MGPVYASETKPHEPEAGLDYLKAASEDSPHPFFAIGGIDAERIGTVLGAGARRIAVSRAVCAADNPEQAARANRLLGTDLSLHDMCELLGRAGIASREVEPGWLAVVGVLASEAHDESDYIRSYEAFRELAGA